MQPITNVLVPILLVTGQPLGRVLRTAWDVNTSKVPKKK